VTFRPPPAIVSAFCPLLPVRFPQVRIAIPGRIDQVKEPENHFPEGFSHPKDCIDIKDAQKDTNKAVPSGVCASCRVLLCTSSPAQGTAWMERGKLASLLPARRVFHFLESDEPEVFTLAGKEYRIQTKIFKGQDMISVCSVCSAEVNLNRHFFDDFGEIPEEISCLNPQEKGQLPLAVLFCSMFRPKRRMSFLHLRGTASVKTRDYDGTLGAVFDPHMKIGTVDLDRIKAALRWLHDNNLLYTFLLAKIETLFGYFNWVGHTQEVGLPSAAAMKWKVPPKQ